MINLRYVIHARFPTQRAHSIQVIKTCEAFADAGADVSLIVPNKKTNFGDINIFSYYKIKENFRIIKLASTDLLGRTLKFGKLFYWIDSISFFVSVYFCHYIKKGDVIYVRDPAILNLFSNKKNVLCVEIHDIPERKKIFIKSIKKAHKVIVLNEIIKSELIELGISENKILVAGDAVDIKEFDIDITKEEAREKLNFPLDKKIVLYTGHLYGWKGAGTLAEAAKNLGQDIEVFFVGGVDKEYKDFTNDYSQIKNIRIIPFQPREKIPLYLKAADILVIPNSASSANSVKYTSPLKLFEYMAAKRPMVVSDLPSMRQVLDEKCCVFAQADKPESFSDAITKVSRDRILSDKLANIAWEKVQNYTWDKRAKKIINFIQ